MNDKSGLPVNGSGYMGFPPGTVLISKPRPLKGDDWEQLFTQGYVTFVYEVTFLPDADVPTVALAD